ncbi:hypothetical protein BDW62DRAFT_67185 [Aspergillus aurantiobrunneus]
MTVLWLKYIFNAISTVHRQGASRKRTMVLCGPLRLSTVFACFARNNNMLRAVFILGGFACRVHCLYCRSLGACEAATVATQAAAGRLPWSFSNTILYTTRDPPRYDMSRSGNLIGAGESHFSTTSLQTLEFSVYIPFSRKAPSNSGLSALPRGKEAAVNCLTHILGPTLPLTTLAKINVGKDGSWIGRLGALISANNG